VRVVTNLAGALKQEIAVAPGQSIKLLEGTPLESEIIVGNGSTVKNPDGSVGAIADGVSLRLLKGVNGGLNLDLAHAEAGVAGSPAVADVIEVPRASELPRTGGNAPWLPVAGATFILAAVVTRRFVLRTR
jgi:LPXTG-motif cell wall-anchored protein